MTEERSGEGMAAAPEPKGRAAAWTEERRAPARSDEGRRRIPSAPEAQRYGAPEARDDSEISDLEVALLGLLSVRPMTGYEIRLHFDRALAPWWDTPRTQIYPKLREMESRGLIEHEYVVQESKPNKRVYSPTGAGRARLRRWLAGTIDWPALRHHMMMRLFLGHLLPADDLRGLLADYRDRTSAWSARLREIEAKFSRSLEGPYRDTVFFELLALRDLIALADFEAGAADRAAKAIGQARTGTRPGNGELAGRLLDIIREHAG